MAMWSVLGQEAQMFWPGMFGKTWVGCYKQLKLNDCRILEADRVCKSGELISTTMFFTFNNNLSAECRIQTGSHKIKVWLADATCLFCHADGLDQTRYHNFQLAEIAWRSWAWGNILARLLTG